MPSKEFEDTLQFLRSLPDTQGLTIQERRAEFEKTVLQFPVAESVSCESLTVGGIPAEWIIPEGSSERKVILFLHGGGYCVGSINTHRGMVSYVSEAAETRALLIDYRLAPENPFPAAVEDSIASYRWLISKDIAAEDIVIAGDSAGGGLALATLASLKEKGEQLPSAAVLISPWVDLEVTGDSVTSKAKVDPIVEKEGLFEMAEAYLSGANPRTPLASPLYADLKDLPPLLIHVGTAEILLDDSTRLADRAREAGVEVILNSWEDMIHVWHFFASILPEARKAIEGMSQFIQKHLED